MHQVDWKFWRRNKPVPVSSPQTPSDREIPADRKPEYVGACETCGVHFRYDLFHNGFGDSAYGYCESCGRTVVLSGWSETARQIALRVHQPFEATIVPLLKPCLCGGRFLPSASPRCPSCSHELSAERATDYIEANAPGTARGWRWQRSWNGIYCIAIEGRVVSDWWDEDKLKPPQAR